VLKQTAVLAAATHTNLYNNFCVFIVDARLFTGGTGLFTAGTGLFTAGTGLFTAGTGLFTAGNGLMKVDFDIAGKITVRYSDCFQHATNVGTQWDSASVTDGGSEACGAGWKGVLRSDVIECAVTTALVRLITKCFNKPQPTSNGRTSLIVIMTWH